MTAQDIPRFGPRGGPSVRRSIGADLAVTVGAGGSSAALAVAAARSNRVEHEELVVEQAGRSLPVRALDDRHGGLLHVVELGEGEATIRYRARVAGGEPEPVTEADTWRYLRPSRYCESDTLTPTARSEFAGAEPAELLEAVSSWVGTRLRYVPGSSGPTDGAVHTLLARQGVCRDYAHVVVALLRALDVPARLVSVYAPGLDPMDFHAVAEAAIDGRWRVVDATALAPRRSLVRIATGRDASDTAFLTNRGGDVRLDELAVTAVADELPDDDVSEPVSLS